MSLHIAIVEDEQKLALTLKEGFEAEGYSVEVFFDGESAEKSLSKPDSTYNLVILDLTLPHKNGFEICRALRGNGIMTPIIILTARDTIQDKVHALDSGADDFLTKPFEFEELMARVRAITRRAQGLLPGRLQIADVVADTRTRMVERAGETVALTPTEFELLTLLIENSDTVLSRDEISNSLWNIKDIALSNIVDVHISNLRKKIDGKHARKIISTIRGRGYRIEK